MQLFVSAHGSPSACYQRFWASFASIMRRRYRKRHAQAILRRRSGKYIFTHGRKTARKHNWNTACESSRFLLDHKTFLELVLTRWYQRLLPVWRSVFSCVFQTAAVRNWVNHVALMWSVNGKQASYIRMCAFQPHWESECKGKRG